MRKAISYKGLMLNSRIWLLSITLACLMVSTVAGAEKCRIDRPQAGALFKLHLSGECTDKEREANAVQAVRILAAIKEGKEVDLSGVVVSGDLKFDELPLR